MYLHQINHAEGNSVHGCSKYIQNEQEKKKKEKRNGPIPQSRNSNRLDDDWIHPIPSPAHALLIPAKHARVWFIVRSVSPRVYKWGTFRPKKKKKKTAPPSMTPARNVQDNHRAATYTNRTCSPQITTLFPLDSQPASQPPSKTHTLQT